MGVDGGRVLRGKEGRMRGEEKEKVRKRDEEERGEKRKRRGIEVVRDKELCS